MSENNNQDGMVNVIAVRLDALTADISDMKSTLKDLANAIIKLALVEERQGQFAQTQERMMAQMDRMDERVDTLEKAAPATERLSMWFERGLWAAVAAVAIYISSKTGLI